MAVLAMPGILESSFRELRQSSTKGMWPKAMWHAIRGEHHARAGRYEEAIAAYDRALIHSPNSLLVLASRARVLADAGRFAEAIADSNLAIKFGDWSVTAHVSSGFVYEAAGRTDEAIAAYRRAIELDPKYYIAYHRFGDALFRAERYDEALAAFDRAAELSPDVVAKLWFFHDTRGRALTSVGRVDEGIAAFDRAIKLAPPDDVSYVHTGRGAALSRAGRFDESIAAFDLAIALAGADNAIDYFYVWRSAHLRLAGRFDEAIMGLGQSLRLQRDPNDKELIELVADTLKSIGDTILEVMENTEYNIKMNDAASALMKAASRHGLPDGVVKTIGKLAAEASRETIDRAPAELCRLNVAMIPDRTATRRLKRYEKLLAQIELPPDGFTTPEQAKAAANLSQTYRRLVEREIAAHVDPTPKDPRVDEAERLRGLYQRHGPASSPKKSAPN